MRRSVLVLRRNLAAIIPTLSPINRNSPGAEIINENYCVVSDDRKNSVFVTGKLVTLNCLNLNLAGQKDYVCDQQEKEIGYFTCKFLCCNSCSFCKRVATKENPDTV